MKKYLETVYKVIIFTSLNQLKHKTMKTIWKYTTKRIRIDIKSKRTIDDELNKLGKQGWEAFMIDTEPYYDRRLQIGIYRIQVATIYIVKFKRCVKSKE